MINDTFRYLWFFPVLMLWILQLSFRHHLGCSLMQVNDRFVIRCKLNWRKFTFPGCFHWNDPLTQNFNTSSCTFRLYYISRSKINASFLFNSWVMSIINDSIHLCPCFPYSRKQCGFFAQIHLPFYFFFFDLGIIIFVERLVVGCSFASVIISWRLKLNTNSLSGLMAA